MRLGREWYVCIYEVYLRRTLLSITYCKGRYLHSSSVSAQPTPRRSRNTYLYEVYDFYIRNEDQFISIHIDTLTALRSPPQTRGWRLEVGGWMSCTTLIWRCSLFSFLSSLYLFCLCGFWLCLTKVVTFRLSTQYRYHTYRTYRVC